MAALSYTVSFPLNLKGCYDGNNNQQEMKTKGLKGLNLNGTFTASSKVNTLSQSTGFDSVSSVTGNGYISKEQIRQNIPTKKQLVDPYRQGLTIEGGVGYRQTLVIRSYEVGPDKTATLESILSLFQVIFVSKHFYIFLTNIHTSIIIKLR